MNSSQIAPRLNSSKTWTELPAEFTAKVQEVFNDEFKLEASRGEFLIDGRIFPEEIVVRIGYLEKGRLKQINFEASMDLPRPKSKERDPMNVEETDDEIESPRGKTQQMSTMDRLYICIDALGSVMDEYFELDEKEEIDVPNRWRPYDFEGDTVYLQHSTANTKLEEEADRLLGLLDKRLVHENEPTDDALLNADVDSELAEAIQKMIREGKYNPIAAEDDSEKEPNLN